MTKRLMMIALIAGTLFGFSTPGNAQYTHDSRYDARRDDQSFGGTKLDAEFNRMQAFFAHVEREMRRHGANRRMWSQYRHLREEFRRLDWQFRRGEQYSHKRQMRDQLAHVRAELHQLEIELRVRPREWYQWR